MTTAAFSRTDPSVLGRWWWTVDRWLLSAALLMAGAGVVLISAASPPVAQRIGLDAFHFVVRHLVLLGPAVAIMLAVSLLSPRQVRAVSTAMLAASMALVCVTLVAGAEIKGAQRWIHLPGFSLQPSEFVKPAFAVVAAWLFARSRTEPGFPGWALSTLVYLAIVGLLILQPDLGMAFVVSAVWFAQFFLAGLPILLVGLLAVLGVGGLAGAYLFLPHVTSRVNRFLDPSSGDTYQVDRSLEAFRNGGLFGTGPGDGTVKLHLPDAHADFVFAVAGEEFGFVFAALIVVAFAFVVLRGFWRAFGCGSLFALLAVGGVCVQIGLQALVNMGSSLHLIPTKGMTLPFMSYGGSSLLAIGFALGVVLALTRVRPGDAEGTP
jgi:cell division protein FtsW